MHNNANFNIIVAHLTMKLQSHISKLFLLFLLNFFFYGCNTIERVKPLETILLAKVDAAQQLSPQWVSSFDKRFLLFQEKNQDSVFLKMFTLGEPSNVEILDAALNSDRFANWADFPAGSFISNSLLYHVLGKVPGSPYAYHVLLKNTMGDDYRILHEDQSPTEHGFVSYAPLVGGVFLSWLDGRETQSTGSTHSHNDDEGSGGAMQLRARFVDDDSVFSPELLLDERVCDCCQTDVVINSQGNPVVFYRDRSEDEIRDIGRAIIGNDSVLDRKLVYSDNWKIGGCPVNGPSAEAIDSTILVAWFSVTEGRNNVKFAFSKNDGWDFEKAVVLDDNGIGRCNVIAYNDLFLIAWMRRTEYDKANIVVSTIDNGKEIKRRVLAETTDAKGVGFPKITVLNESLFLTYVSDAKKQIVVERFALNEVL